MKVAVFSAKEYDREFFEQANQDLGFEVVFFEAHLDANTTKLAEGFDTVCVFVNDELNATVLREIAALGIKLITLRCAGFNNVDLKTAQQLGLTIARVPAYSPHGVAEHTVGLMLALNRKIYRSHNRVRDGNFSLEGLLGFEMHGKTVGIIGSGKIGVLTAKILTGFSMNIVAFDVQENSAMTALGAKYVTLDELYAQSDIITLHLPLMPATHHIIDATSVAKMKNGVMIINTSRGGLIQTQSVINGLKSGKIGFLGLDVYEEEGDLFFEDLSGSVIQDDVFARLLTFPNVMITGHQAFFTNTALSNIAQTTLQNIKDYQTGKIDPANLVKYTPKS